MTQPESSFQPDPNAADIQVGGFYGVPVVRLNRMPTNLPSGEELSNRIVNAFRMFNPELIHPEYGQE